MSQLIPLDEAARMLGLTVDRLTEMRSNNEVFGYRDGATWKFKMTELERVADELGISLGDGAASDELSLEDDDDFELSDSSGDDSLELLQDSSEDLLLDDSVDSSGDMRLEDSGMRKSDDLSLANKESSNVLEDEDELLFGGSSLKLAAGSQPDGKSPIESIDVLDDDDFIMGKEEGSSTGKLMAALDDEDDKPLKLAPAEDDLELMDDSSHDSSELGSDFEDSEIVLDDSDSSSELVLDSGDSLDLGSDSGSDLVLAASLDAGGSDIDNLELAPDDDVLGLGDMADPDAATMMQEDDFNLSPMEDVDPDESSGSQVIALEDSDLFEDSGLDPLAESGDSMEAPALLDDDGLEPAYGGGFDDGFGPGSGLAASGSAAVTMGRPEVPYTLWQVVVLGIVTALLALGCTLLWDIARNLWMAEDFVLSSGLLQMIRDTLGI